jgi:small GTP-binding protein
VRFADDQFDSSLQSTVGVDFKLKTITLMWQRVRLQLWDTSGQERFRSINRAYYRGAQGVVLVYDVCDVVSFRNVTRWVDDIREHATDEDIVVVIVANKIDLAEERIITGQMGRELAERCQCDYWETSAKQGTGVEEAFTSIAQHVMCGGSRRERRRLLRARQRLLGGCVIADAPQGGGGGGGGLLPPSVAALVAARLGAPAAGQSTLVLDQVLDRQEQQVFVVPVNRSGTLGPVRAKWEPVGTGRVSLGYDSGRGGAAAQNGHSGGAGGACW